MKTIKYESITAFDNEFKKLLKKYRTLENDFEIMKRFVLETHFIQNAETNQIVKIQGFCSESYEPYKVRKFACMALKNLGLRTGIRIIFVADYEKETITFIEIYLKQDKANEDKERLKQYIKNTYGI